MAGYSDITKALAAEAKRIEGTVPTGQPKKWKPPKLTSAINPRLLTQEEYDVAWDETGRPVVPDNFDLGSPVNILGEKLPEYALNWMPNGVDPYWGDGFQGFFNRVKNTWGAPVTDDIDYGLEWDKTNVPYAERMMGAGREQAQNNRQYLLDRIGNFLQNTSQAEGESPNLITRATRGAKIIVDGVLSLMQGAAESVERGMGTLTFLAEEAEQKGVGTAITFEDLQAAHEQKVQLPEDVYSGVLQARANVDFLMQKNWARGTIAAIFNAAALPWNALVASKYIRQTVIEDGYDAAEAARMRASNAARMAYTAFADATVKGEYLRRLEAGEDPAMLKYELQDPLQEMIGQLIFDPLNLLGAGPASGAKRLANAVDEIAVPVGRIADAIKDLDKASDAASMAEKTTNLLDAIRDGRRAVMELTDDLSKQRGLRALTAGSKRAIVARRTGDVMKHILSGAVDPDDAIDIFKALINIGSDNAAVAQDAFITLSKSNVSMNVLTSRAGNELGMILESVMKNDGDDLLKLLGSFGDDVADSKKIEKLTGFFDDTAGRVINDLFPKVSGLPIEELSWIERKIATFHDSAQKGIVGGINKFFANVYMGLSPGYAFRNAITNTLHVFVDHGARPFTMTPTQWLGRASEWLGGMVPDSMKAGFGAAQALPDGVDTSKKLFGIVPNMLKASARMEQRAGARVMGKVIEDVMTAALQPGRALPDVRTLLDAGLSREAASYLTDLVIKHRGDVSAAVTDMRKAFSAGQLDVFSSGRWITAEQRKILGNAGVMQYVEDAVKMREEGKSIDEVLAYLDDVLQGQVDEAANVVGESSAAENLEDVFPHMAEAVDDGALSPAAGEGMTNRYVANSMAIQDYTESANKILQREILAAASRGDEEAVAILNKIGEKYSPYTLGTVGSEHMNQSRQFTESIWQATREIRAEPRNADWASVWNKHLGQIGPAPEGVTRKDILNTLWDELFRPTQKKRWEQARDEHAGVLELMLTEISSVTGTDFVSDPLLAQARATMYNARKYDAIDVATENMMYILKGADYFSPGTFEIQLLAARMGIPTVGENGKMIPGAIDVLVDIINRNLPDGVERFHHIRDIEQLSDIPVNVARDALNKHYGIAQQTAETAAATVEDLGEIAYKSVWSRVEEVLPELGLNEVQVGNIQELSMQLRDGKITVDEYRAGVLAAIDSASPPPDSFDVFRHASMRAEVERLIDAPVIEKGLDLPVPELGAATPSYSRVVHENLDGLRQVFGQLKDSARKTWGTYEQVVEGGEDVQKALDAWALTATQRVSEARMSAVATAEAARDFTLIGYGTEKQNLDLALSYLYPYQFWYRKTYQNWIRRIVTRPGVVAGYAKYKEALSQIHAGMPEWWKYNINTNELLGLDSENPLFFNLEATLNPLNGLTGIDFDDPHKKVDWWTTTLHGLGMFGPSTWTPLSIATAIAMSAKGEEEAAARWAGRLFPQTATLKAATSLMGLGSGGVELDPLVHIFSGGIDPYERRRIGRALATLQDRGNYSPEEIVDAGYTQTGQAWTDASFLAANQRAWGQISSFFLGTGFKARNNTDVEIDRMYTEYFGLWAQEPDLSGDELRMGLDNLRAKYPFMDAVLLARKGGIDRDRAYAYNVIGRIAPGQKSEIAEAVGIPPDLLSKFYDSKGHIEDWPESERMRFMAGIAEIGATLAIPQNTTRQEWGEASSLYGEMMDNAPDLFGENIAELTEIYFSMKGTTQAEKDAAEAFLAEHPEVGDFLDWKAHTITNTPQLATYYGGIEQIEQYFKGAMYNAIEQELGADIWGLWDEYYNLKDTGGDYRGFYRSHPELERYWEIKDEWQERIDSGIVSFGSRLQEAQPTTLRDDAGSTIASRDAMDAVNELSQPQTIPPEVLQNVITAYGGEQLWRLTQDEEPLPEVAVERLQGLADALGLTLQEILQQVR